MSDEKPIYHARPSLPSDDIPLEAMATVTALQQRIAELEEKMGLLEWAVKAKDRQILELIDTHDAIVKKQAAALAEVKQKITRIVGIVQRYQPAGSPPPGDEEVLVRWILVEVTRERDEAKAELASAKKVNAAASIVLRDEAEARARAEALLIREKSALAEVTQEKERAVDRIVQLQKEIDELLADAAREG